MPVPSPPANVWVVVEIYSKSVQISHGASTQPISGKAAIFQKPEVTQQVAARVYGVYATEADARRDLRPKEGAEYLVDCHSVWSHKGLVPVEPAAPAPQGCILCGAPTATSYCKPCEQERFRIMRERDMGIIEEQVPAGA